MYIQLNGQVLYYEKYDECETQNPPLILLHGNGEDHSIWNEFAEEMKSEHVIYALDSRGQGASATPKEYHYEDMANDVIHFIESQEINLPTIVGFSDGAIVALLVAMKRQQLLSGIVLCGANLSPKGLTMSASHEIKKLYKKHPSPLIQMMLVEPNIDPIMLPAVTIPALVIAGSKDMIKEKETKQIASSLSNATLKIIPGATHMSYVEHSTELVPYVKEFILQL